jgi:hypothetical protein
MFNRRNPAVLYLGLLCSAIVWPVIVLGADRPDSLTDDSIVQMLDWKMTRGEIIRVIRASGAPTKFQLTAESINNLKSKGATDAVITAMLQAMTKAAKSAQAAPPPQPPSRSQSTNSAPAPPIGTPQSSTTQNPAVINTPAPPPRVPPVSGRETGAGPTSTGAAQPSAATQNPGSTNTPPPPPQVPPIPGSQTVTVPGPPTVTPAPQGGPPSDDRYRQALIPIVRARRPSPQQPLSSPMVYQLEFGNATTSPDTIYTSGDSILRLSDVNTILYTYQVQVKEIKGTGDDLSQWAGLIKEVTQNLIPQTNPAAMQNACQLATLENQANTDLTGIQTKIQQMLPDKPSGGNYKSISYSTSKSAWDEIRTLYDRFENDITSLQAELAKPVCFTELDAMTSSEALILEAFPQMRAHVDEVQKKADAPWQDVPYRLTRTSDFTVTATEEFGNVPTEAKPVVFNLNHGYSILTLSGGFLLTKIQARTYSSVAEPFTPTGSTTPITQNVLSVGGLGSGMRPALIALFNYHDPFNWKLNQPNFGFALSAGPVIDVSNGKADTSKFGVFAGGSAHIWSRLFVTAGVHFGEFSDFPVGYHAAGEVIPANSGTPVGVTRWTGRLAIAITFQGKDLSGLVQNANNPSSASSPKSK